MSHPRSSRTALVLYGSETGNAQDIAEEIGRLCERLRFDTQVLELNAIDLKQLLRATIVLFSISTTGQGELPANAHKFWRALRSSRLVPGSLRSIQFSSFGLGDSSYPQFNWAHRKLYNRLVQLGAQPFYDRGEADEQHSEGLDGLFLPWLLDLKKRIVARFPLPEGLDPIPDHVPLQPKWVLTQIDGAFNRNEGTDTGTEPSAIPKEEQQPLDGLLDIDFGLKAEVKSNVRVTPSAHWQDVRHITLDVAEDRHYGPGDVLTIYPKNFPKDVDHLINLMEWSSIADTPLEWSPSATIDAPSGSPRPSCRMSHTRYLTIRELLTNHLDIMSIPRRSFFTNLQEFTNDEYHRERLREFTDPQYIDELYDYTTRPRRSILEVLDEFTSVRIPWQRICSVIPAMRGRQFSIASGGVLKKINNRTQLFGSSATLRSADLQSAPQDGTRFELLVAIVKYRTVIKRIREGVATRYIASLRPGQQITVTMQKGGLNVNTEQLSKPLIMIGPGTGVAPMRSLIYERLERIDHSFSLGSSTHTGKPICGVRRATLFFGCRNREADYFFSEEWTKLSRQGQLQVFTAFSRDQQRKVYVQDLIKEHSDVVHEALVEGGGMVFVCGSSGKMPQAVRLALVEVFTARSGLNHAEAEAFMLRMEKEGRYKQETW